MHGNPPGVRFILALDSDSDCFLQERMFALVLAITAF